MFSHTDDCAKRRLTESAELRIAVEFLSQHGYRGDDIGVQLSKFYYIDIDALNEVIAEMALGDETAGQHDWQKVA